MKIKCSLYFSLSILLPGCDGAAVTPLRHCTTGVRHSLSLSQRESVVPGAHSAPQLPESGRAIHRCVQARICVPRSCTYTNISP